MKHAPHDTRLGQLQRGRGAGFLAACASPRAARHDLLQCILTDPRIDRQLESRDCYYAELALRLDLDVAPLVERARTDEDEPLALGVLAEMAARGQADALALLDEPGRQPEITAGLAEHLRAYPQWAIANLQRPVVELLAEQLHARDDLAHDVEIFGEFWQPWRTVLPRVERAFIDSAAMAAAAAATAPAPLPDPASLSLEALLDCIGGQDTPRISSELLQRSAESDRALLALCVEYSQENGRQASIAAETLGTFGDLRLLEAAESMFARTDLDPYDASDGSAMERRRRSALAFYFSALPPAVSLPLARTWWPRGGYFRRAAGSVLRHHAQASDRPYLEDFVRRTIRRDSWHALNEIEALVHIGAAASLPTLIEVTEHATYAWARTRALPGVAAMAADRRAQTVLREALWDCEDEARELGCQHTDLSLPQTRHRIAELAAAPWTDERTREVAAARAAV